MLEKRDWASLIPHAGTMCLLDEVMDWNATRLHACSASHSRPDNPLRADGMLHAVNLCEYAAQAMAVHGECLIAMPGSMQYAFRVELRGSVLASGRAAVMLRQGR